jgi:hypothetical protein
MAWGFFYPARLTRAAGVGLRQGLEQKVRPGRPSGEETADIIEADPEGFVELPVNGRQRSQECGGSRRPLGILEDPPLINAAPMGKKLRFRPAGETRMGS